MVMITTMPKTVSAELLEFLADHEEFESSISLLEGEVTTVQVRGLLRELAVELRREAIAETTRYDAKADAYLRRRSKQLLGCLSPLEEQTLLKTFGITETD